MTNGNGIQKNARYFFKFHRRLIKPPYPVKIHCPGCGRPFVRVNTDLIEVENSFGMQERELKAVDTWTEYRHTCGTKIVTYWKD